MSFKILKKLKGDRKYFAIVFFVLILFFLSGIISPIIVKQVENNWDEKLSSKIEEIQKYVTAAFDRKENTLLYAAASVKYNLRKVLQPKNSSYGALIKLVNEKAYQNYSIEVLAPNGKLIAWNVQIAIPQNDILPMAFPPGQAHFYDTDLSTYLTVTDTLIVENEVFYFVVSNVIEKQFKLNNAYFRQINFSGEMSEKYLTQFNIDYSPFAEGTLDGRKYSFVLTNRQGNKIGEVTFTKPTLNTTIDTIYRNSAQIQSILVFLAGIIIAIGFRKEYKELKYRTAKILTLTFYLTLFRMLLFVVNFPSGILSGSLVDPVYFSSAFGAGIVKSPVEFFVTALFVLIIALNGFRYLLNYLRYSQKILKKNTIIFSILFFPLSFLFFLTLRGLSASVRSVIFDSTLRYFKEPDLIPNLPSIVMNLNLLMLGVAVVLLLCAYVLLLMALIPENDGRKIKLYFMLLFLVFQILGFIFISAENEPLITPILSALFVTFIIGLCYKIYVKKNGEEFNFIYVTLIASVISITLLNYFNVNLEKQSLKTTAMEINRPNDSLLKFLITETLTNASNNEDIIMDFGLRNSNYDADAFRFWANSSLQRESLNSSVSIWNKDQLKIGSFSVGINVGNKLPSQFYRYSGSEPKIIEISEGQDSSNKIFKGIVPVYDRGIKLGYITASIGFDIRNLGTNEIPLFLESEKNILNSVIDIRQLKIFDINGSQLKEVYGDIYPSRDQIKPIINAHFSQDNEAWLNLDLNGQNYYTYILKTFPNGNERITAVLTREKKISWDFFNFFKIFLIHSIFIIFALALLLLIKIREYRYSFRAQLLIAFLLVSLLPIIVLAFYNRQIVQQRSQTAIFNDLNDRVNYIEKYITTELGRNRDLDLVQVFNKAGQDLGIAFSVYDGTTSLYNSKYQYFKIGLFNDRLNPIAYYQLNYLSYREYLTQENIEGFGFDAFYKKFSIGDKPLIIGVNDAFNKVRLSFSVVDIDVFLFGIFSFTTFIMILLSAFLAGRISLPIRRLTKATDSVAHGDLSVELENSEKGELRELYDGFNAMTRELQKNQSELAELERETAWKEMAKQVAHEIKNPLTPMKLAVQQLIASYRDRNKNFNEMFEKLSTTLLNQIESLSSIASEFSRFARMPNYNLEKLDLLVVLDDAVNLFVDEHIKIDLTCSFNNAFIEGDKAQLRRVFINFIRNSIQAGATRVDFNINEEGENFIILIKDNGKGIAENIRSKIFEPNFTTKEKGMGIGLKLAKRFIESINGKISVTDSEKSGAEFKITVPRFQK